MLPTKFRFGSFGKVVSEEKISRNRTIRNKNWLFSDWLISKKSSPLKPLSQTNQNLVGSILGRSSIKIAHLVPIGYKMSSRYRGPSIDVSYQVSVHLAEGFQRRRLQCGKLTDDTDAT
jgi:hypothetical protein